MEPEVVPQLGMERADGHRTLPAQDRTVADASQDLYPRLLADLNGDGAADIVGFGDGGVIAATSVSDWVLV